MRPFYITTPIYYVNDVPHLGHAYTTIAADAIARFHRMRGDDTFFLTGTDEHGQKVEEAAQQRGLSAKELVDQVAPRFEETWKKLGIGHDYFIRTTSERHKKVVTDLWKKMSAAGDLYLGAYEGWYCVGCEAFYTESQLEKLDGQWSCTTHKRPVSWIAKERSWFFRMSKYGQRLLDHIEANPDFIQPDGYRNEVVSFVKSGLRDLSVSRTSFSWGIPVPEPDPEGQSHVIFVWVDALTNYVSALCDDGLGGELYDRFWKSAVHLIGKDILRFHAVYWPCFLLSAGLPLPKRIFTHGWWTVSGQKISKSILATKIDPIKVSEALGAQTSFELGVDAMRYYLLREVPLGLDGDFTFESLFGRYNAELANDLGNLVNRSLTLVPRLMTEDVQARVEDTFRARDDEVRLAFASGNAVREAAIHFDAMAPNRALEAIWRLVREANRYIDAAQPWRVAASGSAAEKGHVAYYMLGALQTIGRLVYPVLPATCRVIRLAILDCDPQQPEKTLQQIPAWPDETFGADLVPRPVTKPTVLFPRLDDKRQDEIVAMIAPREAKVTQPMGSGAAEAPGAGAVAGKAPTYTFEDFMKAELRSVRSWRPRRCPRRRSCSSSRSTSARAGGGRSSPGSPRRTPRRSWWGAR